MNLTSSRLRPGVKILSIFVARYLRDEGLTADGRDSSSPLPFVVKSCLRRGAAHIVIEASLTKPLLELNQVLLRVYKYR
jgi:hypothetical protein